MITNEENQNTIGLTVQRKPTITLNIIVGEHVHCYYDV